MGGETKTTTENRIPAYQEEYLKGAVFPFATNLATQPVTPYGGPMTAPLSALSGEAADVYRRMGEAPDIAGRTAANFAAMKETVLDPQIAAMARQRAQEMTGQEGDIIRSGAFDASRRGVYEGERAAAYEAGVSNLMAQGYSQAQAAAMAQAQAEQAGLGASAAGLGGAKLGGNGALARCRRTLINQPLLLTLPERKLLPVALLLLKAAVCVAEEARLVATQRGCRVPKGGEAEHRALTARQVLWAKWLVASRLLRGHLLRYRLVGHLRPHYSCNVVLRLFIRRHSAIFRHCAWSGVVCRHCKRWIAKPLELLREVFR